MTPRGPLLELLREHAKPAGARAVVSLGRLAKVFLGGTVEARRRVYDPRSELKNW